MESVEIPVWLGDPQGHNPQLRNYCQLGEEGESLVFYGCGHWLFAQALSIAPYPYMYGTTNWYQQVVRVKERVGKRLVIPGKPQEK